MTMESKPKIICLHIPKCAGTTFRVNFLSKVFPKRVLCYDQTYHQYSIKRDYIVNKSDAFDETIKVYPARYKDCDVITGHFKKQKYNFFGSSIATFLRDPVSRAISAYNMVTVYKPEHGSYVTKYSPYYKWSVVEFAETQKNFMTMLLDGNLNDIEFIGITERFDESVDRFIKHFNIQTNWRINHAKRNVTKRKTNVSKEERRIIKEMNKEDYELYNEALSRFEKEK